MLYEVITLLHLGTDRHEHINHALSDVIRVKAAIEFRILAGDTLRAQADITDVAAPLLIAQAAGAGLHDILANMDAGGAEHNQSHTILGHVAILAHTTGGKQRNLV